MHVGQFLNEHAIGIHVQIAVTIGTGERAALTIGKVSDVGRADSGGSPVRHVQK